jgi:hypothetical protein
MSSAKTTGFAGTLRAVESAWAGLSRAASDTAAWSDGKRREFDASRMKPLAEAGTTLARALRQAQERQQVIERLLRDL